MDINCGDGFVFTILPDRCMDIAQTSYMGESLSWISKTGITAPQFYDNKNKQWLRGFYGGLITTCGLRQVGSPSTVEGEDFGLHGVISNTPASNISIDTGWEGDDYIMKVSGEMRESIVFGENILLKREITAKMGGKSLYVRDTIVNEGFSNEKILQLYHCNFGFPAIDDGAVLKFPKGKITPVTQNAAEGADTMQSLHKPTHSYTEQCFFVDFEDNIVFIEIENSNLKNCRGIYMKYDKKQLPCFTLWKMMGEGDYVVGLEPGLCCPMGREKSLNKGLALDLPPFSEYICELEIGVI
ncbi:MAG: DUF4432 family protein [Candidatus Moranbacteria bacterium]|nr:DUF4432 family protein [Candidatus Moranbacteria bacterium]